MNTETTFNPFTKLNHSQKLFTAPQWKQLQDNSKNRPETVKPVVKLFDPMGAGTWLLSECDDDGIAFGLCDLGFGSPELGYVSMEEVCDIQKTRMLGIERDLHFKPNKTLAEYANEAREIGRIKA